jgi:hypothetical protein
MKIQHLVGVEQGFFRENAKIVSGVLILEVMDVGRSGGEDSGGTSHEIVTYQSIL